MGSRGAPNGPRGRASPSKADRLSPIKNDRLSPTKNDRLSPTKNDRLSPTKNDRSSPTKNDRSTPVRNGILNPLKDEKPLHKSESIPSMGTPGSDFRGDAYNGPSRVSFRSEEALKDKEYNNDYAKGKFTGKVTLKSSFG